MEVKLKLLKVDTLQEAKARLLEAVSRWKLKTVTIPVLEALNRILANQVRSDCDVPEFRRSTVDGYAVIAKDTQGASESLPVFLEIMEEINIGHSPKYAITSGQCSYVPTGGMIPKGADAVVMIEYTEPFHEKNIAVYDSVSYGRNLVQIGEDIKEGVLLLEQGIRLRPQDIGALAAAGFSEVEVYVPLSISVISTGEELVSPEERPPLGKIRDINTFALAAQAMKHGFQLDRTIVIHDEEEMLEQILREVLITSDFVLISGGSSQGKKDITLQVMDQVLTPGVFTHGLALKPGKPTILGYDESSETVVFGLPGHPAAAMLVFELLGAWLYQTMLGMSAQRIVHAGMEVNYASAPGKETCLLVELKETKEGYIAVPILGKSGMITTLTKADGYILIPANKEGLKDKEQVVVYPLLN